ncbi:cryptochrome/photolyase family protein [Thermosynechococcus sp.]|uniref:cryptochrome/photolyase family protein n=1 Tax=Thermosynechococcus sp. TaxID=2814275 RepID=UPI0037DDCF4C
MPLNSCRTITFSGQKRTFSSGQPLAKPLSWSTFYRAGRRRFQILMEGKSPCWRQMELRC